MVPWIYMCYNNEFAAGGDDKSGGNGTAGQGAQGASGGDNSATADLSK